MKRILTLVLVITIFFSFASIALATTSISVVVDGKLVQFSDEYGFPFIDEYSRTQVPLRVVTESFGCTTQWDQSSYSVTITRGSIIVVVPINQKHIYINGEKRAINTEATIIDGRTYIPIQPILEAFGALVEWDSKTKTITIFSSAQPSIIEYYQNIHIDNNGFLIFTLPNGETINAGSVYGKNGRDGSDGSDGSDGVSVSNIQIDQSGDLIVTLSNGRIINAGGVNTETTSKTFADYEVGTRFYLTQPEGEFEVSVFIGESLETEIVVHFEEIYYELTEKNSFDDSSAWYYSKGHTQYCPYEITVHIEGYIEPVVDITRIRISLMDISTHSSWGYEVDSINENGDFLIDTLQKPNTWYKPPKLYLRHVSLTLPDLSDD